MKMFDPACTCWSVETSDGTIRPLRWVDLHEHVVLVTTDDRVVAGLSLGARSRGPGSSGQTAQYGVEQVANGELVLVDRGEIRTVRPTSGYDDLPSLLAAITETLTQPGAMVNAAEPARFRYVISDHEVLDFEINYESFSCAPTAAPPPRQDTAAPHD